MITKYKQLTRFIENDLTKLERKYDNFETPASVAQTCLNLPEPIPLLSIIGITYTTPDGQCNCPRCQQERGNERN